MRNEPVQTAEQGPTLTACHECDLLVRETAAPGARHFSALCPRCGALLYRHSHNSLENTLALALAALVLLAVANAFPVVGLNIQGQRIETTVVGAAMQLWRDDMPAVSILVLATTTMTPLLEMAAIIWLTLPLKFGRRPPGFARVFRALQAAHPWAMVEVFMLGILVALVKLSHLADVIPGPAMACFGLLMLLLTALSAIVEPRDLWRAWGVAGVSRSTAPRMRNGSAVQSRDSIGTTISALRAASVGKTVCHTCGRLGSPASERVCGRCGSALHFRRPDSIQRSWALLIAAYALYLPANLLPIMETSSMFGTQQDTIMSGVVYLWHSGSWVLALVVFIASVAVPLLKMLSLTVLLASVQRRSTRQALQRTKLYRLLELIGRWSMLDVYVVTILVALVQVQSLASIRPGAGVIAFAGVVVLSMLATMAFEPRLIWDAVDNPNDNSSRKESP